MRPSHIHHVLFLAIVLSVGPARADEGIYEYLLKSTVWIVAPRTGEGGALALSLGTGSLVDESERLVVTAAHVMKGASGALLFFPRFDDRRLVINRQAYLHDRQRIGILGRVVWRDTSRDLALLKLDYLPYDVQSLPIASGSARRASRVHILGNPKTSGSLWVYSMGHVRQTGNIPLPGSSDYSAWVIEVQSQLWRGNSGGPVVNDAGDLVGVVSLGVLGEKNEREEGNFEEALYCVDASEVRTILDAYLGDQDLSLNLRELRQNSVSSESTLADTNGKLVVVNRYRSDILVTINGQSYSAPMGRSELWVPYQPVEAYLTGYQSKQKWDHWHWAGDHYEMEFRINF